MLVIFDCDGVLVDSEPLVTAVHVEHLAREGYTIDAAQMVERRAPPHRVITLRRLLGWKIDERAQAATTR